MVRKIMQKYLPAISMSFTVIILLAGLISWISGKKQDIFISFSFEAVVYLIITCILDALIQRINFKSYLSHFAAECVLIYPVTLFFAVWFHWIGISAVHILLYSGAYILIMSGIHFYFYITEKSSVAELNQLLEERSRKNG